MKLLILMLLILLMTINLILLHLHLQSASSPTHKVHAPGRTPGATIVADELTRLDDLLVPAQPSSSTASASAEQGPKAMEPPDQDQQSPEPDSIKGSPPP